MGEGAGVPLKAGVPSGPHLHHTGDVWISNLIPYALSASWVRAPLLPLPPHFTAGLVTGWSLAFLAFERYIVICKPFGNFRFSSKHALVVVLATWVIGVGVSIPPFFGWSR